MKRILLNAFLILFSVFLRAPEAMGQGSWSKDTSTGFIARYSHTTSVAGGRIYVIGGNTPAALQVFDPVSHSWTTPATGGNYSSYSGLTSSVIHDSIFVIGGDPWVAAYDPVSALWSMPVTGGNVTQRSGLHALAIDDKIYVFGWLFHSHVYDNSVEVFDPSANRWNKADTTGLPYLRMTVFPNYALNNIYVFGWPPVVALDPQSGVWSTPIIHGDDTIASIFSTCVLNEKIYILGRTVYGKNCMQVFDPANNSLSTPETHGTFIAGEGLAACVTNGKIYVLGGYDSLSQPSNIVEVYSPDASDVKKEVSSLSITVSPNPTTGIVTVQNISADIQHITILNLLGESVAERAHPNTPEFTIDLSKLPLGIYVAKFMIGNEIVTRKILKR